MSSSSFVDFLAEKLYSFSSMMKGDSFQTFGNSYLMSGNSIQQHDPMRVLNELRENGIFDFEAANPYNRNLILNQMLGILGSNHGLNFLQGLQKPEYFFTQSKTRFFSPHVQDLISALNSYCCKNIPVDMSVTPNNSLFSSQINSLFCESSVMKSNLESDSEAKKTCNSPKSEVNISANINLSPPMEKPEVSEKKCNLSASLKLNLTLSNRKTKQMNKRSKNRRRRQKKVQPSDVDNTNSSLSDDENGGNRSPVSSHVCFLAESPDFGCRVSLSQTIQLSPPSISSFVVSAESDSNDDSEWESYDETDSCVERFSKCNGLSFTDSTPAKSESTNSRCSTPSDYNMKVSAFSFVVPVEDSNDDSDWESYDETDSCVERLNNCNVLSSTDSTPAKSKSTHSRCSTPSDFNMQVSAFSFVVPVGDSNDDDSDWDACDSGDFAECSEFEFSGLFMTNLCTPHTFSSDTKCDSNVFFENEPEELLQLKNTLIEVNNNWNKLTTRDDTMRMSTSKVTFASDEDLVEVFPVEIYERKGEWETYALERFRFRRKIDELEKVLSPCLNPEHRSKVFKKLIEPDL